MPNGLVGSKEFRKRGKDGGWERGHKGKASCRVETRNHSQRTTLGRIYYGKRGKAKRKTV